MTAVAGIKIHLVDNNRLVARVQTLKIIMLWLMMSKIVSPYPERLRERQERIVESEWSSVEDGLDNVSLTVQPLE